MGVTDNGAGDNEFFIAVLAFELDFVLFIPIDVVDDVPDVAVDDNDWLKINIIYLNTMVLFFSSTNDVSGVMERMLYFY